MVVGALVVLSDQRGVLAVPVSGLGRRSAALGGSLGGWAGGFEDCGATAQEEGKRAGPWLWHERPWALPLPRAAAAVSTGSRVLGVVVQQALPREELQLHALEGVEVVDGGQQHLARGAAC